MSEELLQRKPIKIGKNWLYWEIGQTTVNQLKKEGIVRNVDYGSVESKKVDGLLMEYKKVIAVVEWKTPKEFNTQKKKNKAILQEIEVAKKLRAKLYVLTDGQETLWINVETGNSVKEENWNEFKYQFNTNDPQLQRIIEKVLQSISENNDRVLPVELVNPINLASQVNQELWMIRKNPEIRLYTFVELFIFKYLSDLGILTGLYNFDHLFGLYKKNNTSSAVLTHYANTIRPKIKELFPENDKTTIINGTIFVDKEQKAVNGYGDAFKSIIEKFENYGKLENIDHDFKSKLFEIFLKESKTVKEWGQYFTPLKVVKAVVRMAGEPKEGMKICDPACGVGKFPLEFIKSKIDELFVIENVVEEGKTKQILKNKVEIIGFDRGDLDGNERITIILSKANMLIYLCELIKNYTGLTQEFSKLFSKSFVLKNASTLGTLSDLSYKNELDLILTNPPYVMSGSGSLKKEIAKDSELEKFYKTNAMGLEGLFMEWIIRSLKPTGRAFIVIPDGILNRQNDDKLRQFILDNCYIDAIISLPIDTFFQNSKKTYILALTKKEKNKEGISKKQTDPVFTYLVSEIGESRDVNRFDIPQDDLNEAVILFQFFKANKREFQRKYMKEDEAKKDSRLKIWEIDKFDPKTSWAVDRWWTKEEKIELGIIEKENVVDFKNLGEIVKEIASELNNYGDLITEIGQKEVSSSNLKDISLEDDQYFNLFIGKRVVKKEIVKLNGIIPIYSANVKVPMGYHEENIISDFNNNFVLWGIDGDFEFNFIPKNQPFYPTDHCGVIRILNDSILPEYLVFQLKNVRHKFGFDRGLRASLENMGKVQVPIPFNERGIDITKQREIVEKYRQAEGLKKTVGLEKKRINDLIVSISDKLQEREIAIGEIFDLSKSETNGGRLTKSFVNKHQGNIPVYGASKDEKLVNYGYIQDKLKGIKYFENCLTWNRNGSIGKVFLRQGRFSLSTDVIPLIVRDEYKNSIDLLCLKYAMEKELVKEDFGFGNKAGKDRIKDIKIKIPINSQGNFDLIKQGEIAEKYKQIEKIKKKMIKKLEIIESMKTDLEIGE